MTTDAIIGLTTLASLVVLYFLPAIIAKAQGKRTTAAIFVLTLLTGWTGLGWIVALVWAFVPDAPAQRAQEPDLLLVPTHWAERGN